MEVARDESCYEKKDRHWGEIGMRLPRRRFTNLLLSAPVVAGGISAAVGARPTPNRPTAAGSTPAPDGTIAQPAIPAATRRRTPKAVSMAARG